MKIKQKAAAAAAAALICLMLIRIPAAAEEAWDKEGKSSTQIPVHVSVEVKNVPQEDTEIYTIRLTAADGAPMPEGYGSYADLKLAGGETGAFPVINYETPGIYYYTVWQEAGESPKETISYDKTNFFLKVTAFAVPDGTIKTAAAVYTDEARQGEKQQDIIFINEYRPEESTEESTEETIGESTGESAAEATEEASEETTEQAAESSAEESPAETQPEPTETTAASQTEEETKGQTSVAQILGIEDRSFRDGMLLISAGAVLLGGAGIAGLVSRKKR